MVWGNRTWKELLRAMIGMEDNGNAIRRCDRANVMSSGDGAGNRGLLLSVRDPLAGEKGSSALRELKDYWRFCVSSCLKCCDDD